MGASRDPPQYRGQKHGRASNIGHLAELLFLLES